nr:replication initiator protein A [Parasphingorhabdus flavimaris]
MRIPRDIAELPFFVPSKRRLRDVSYCRSRNDLEFRAASGEGMYIPHVWDMDIFLVIVSEAFRQIMAADANSKMFDCDKTVYVVPRNLLEAANRNSGGSDYQDLFNCMSRLSSARYTLKGPIGHCPKGVQQEIRLINGWKKIYSDNNRFPRGMAIRLSPWLYRQLLSTQNLLAVDPAYMKIRSGIGRRLYSLCRKHAHGQPNGINFKISTLHQKFGAEQRLPQFTKSLKDLAISAVPGYILDWLPLSKAGEAMLNIRPDPHHEFVGALVRTHRDNRLIEKCEFLNEVTLQKYAPLDDTDFLKKCSERYPGANLLDLKKKFIAWNEEKGTELRSVSQAFESFVRSDLQRNVREAGSAY